MMQTKQQLLFSMKILLFFSSVLSSIMSQAVQGQLNVEYTMFLHESLLSGQSMQQNNASSMALELDYNIEWNNRADNLTFIPYARYDDQDEERTHLDIRELLWTHWNGPIEYRVGIGREFWGVTEFFHLVDVITQVDFVENLRSESKLGQAMVAVGYQGTIHRFEFWWLPYFRERPFAASDARFQLSNILNSDQALYESPDKKHHDDFAVRWSAVIGTDNFGSADIGISYFTGTVRDPRFIINPLVADLQLVPYYEQIKQWSLDLQWVWGDYLWKLEGLHRHGQGNDYTASTGGLEYSFVGISDSHTNLGLVLEYMYDERAEQANHFFQDDIGVGLRFTLNDEENTTVLFSYLEDQENSSTLWRIEAERRLNENWTIKTEVYAFDNIAKSDLLFGLREDDYIRVELSRYF